MDMKRIVNENILDIIPAGNGFIYAQKRHIPDDKIKISYTNYSIDSKSSHPTTKKVYLLSKFGGSYIPITNKLGNFLSCSAGVLHDKRIMVIYPSGDAGIFSPDGAMEWTGSLTYHEAPMKGILVYGKNIWCVSPEANAVICYNYINMKIDLRIGGGLVPAFHKPESITRYENKFYVSNLGSGKVRIVDVHNYSVNDYLKFDEPVYRYFRIKNAELVQLKSGVYLL